MTAGKRSAQAKRVARKCEAKPAASNQAADADDVIAPPQLALSTEQRKHLLSFAVEMRLTPDEECKFIDSIEYLICLHREWMSDKYDQESARDYLDRFVAACELVERTLDDATYWESVPNVDRMAAARELARHHPLARRGYTADQAAIETLVRQVAVWRRAATRAIESRPLNRHAKDQYLRESLVKQLDAEWGKCIRSRPPLCEIRGELAPRAFLVACAEIAAPGSKPGAWRSVRYRKSNR